MPVAKLPCPKNADRGSLDERPCGRFHARAIDPVIARDYQTRPNSLPHRLRTAYGAGTGLAIGVLRVEHRYTLRQATPRIMAGLAEAWLARVRSLHARDHRPARRCSAGHR